MAPPRTPDPELAAALCVMREERGLTRDQLAHRCGISGERLARIESGQVVPPFELVRRLVRAVGVELIEVGSASQLAGSQAGAHATRRRRYQPRHGPTRR